MPEFTVETQSLKRNAALFKNHAGTLNRTASEINRLKNQLYFSGSFAQIRSSLGRIGTALGSEKSKLDAMSSALGQIASTYESTEKEIAGAQKKPVTSIAWIAGAVAKSGKLFGFDSRGEASGELFGASYKTKATSGVKWKIEKDENGNKVKKLDSVSLVDASISGEAHVAKGAVKGNIGLLGGEMEAAVGTVVASGHIGASLIKGGKFTPQVEAGVEASAVAAQGSAKVSGGTEDYNVHGKAEGKLGSAKAAAGIGAGRITVKDENTGETKTITGVKAEAKAEAYAAEGRVSGGFTICGVKIDIGISGKAGGAGGSIGGYVGTGGASGKISAGLGVGAGIDFSIDWSGFKLFRKK